ncbi:MAG: 6,7-dimethyl-8-ribityllumazine synthase [Geminicoccaceae bacterium]
MTRPTRIAFIKARWHADIVDQAHAGFFERLGELLPSATLSVFEVPGAFEMPLLAKRLASSGDFDVIAAAAFVVNGGIYRHDFVAQAVITGLMDVQLETDVPVLSVSLTPHHFQPTDEHTAFFKAHFVKKGQEAADAAAAVLALDQATVQRHVA